jgi:D-alanyl-D-alanine carboxypeptidase
MVPRHRLERIRSPRFAPPGTRKAASQAPPITNAHPRRRSLALVGQGALALACVSLALATSPARATYVPTLADVQPYVPTRADVQRALHQLVAAGAPGVTAVIRGPRGVERYSAGLANLRRGTPISPRDHFRIGSVTKTFVSTVVLQLVAKGRLSLADSVERWLPGLVPNGNQVTVRELLDHSSGIFDYCNLPSYPTLCSPRGPDMTRRWTQQQLVQLVASAPPLFPPGQGWAYSNTDYVLLGLIVERVTGHTLEQELERRIYRPLGLHNTRFPIATAMPRPYAHGYDVSANGIWPLDVTAISPTIAWGAGAMVSTPGDLVTFMRALLRGRLTTQSLLRQMKQPTPDSLTGSPYSLGPGLGSYGFGLIHYTWAAACGAWGHTGDFPGYVTVAMASPNGRRGAAVNVTSDTITTAGQLAGIVVERRLACRMRFGRIGS